MSNLFDNVVKAREIVDGINSGTYGVGVNELTYMFNLVFSILTDGVGMVSGMFNGEPYPSDKLEATDIQSDSVTLGWESALNADYQSIMRSPDNVAFTEIDTVGGATNTYEDTTVAADTTYYYNITATAKIGRGDNRNFVWRLNDYLAEAYPEDITAGITDQMMFVPPQDGKIAIAGLYLENTGTDGGNPLELELDIKIPDPDTGTPTSIFTVKPKLTKDAADQSSTFIAGTGVTVGVIDENVWWYKAGDLVTLTLTLTRTASPADEMAGVVIILSLSEGDLKTSLPSNTILVTTLAV